MEYFKLNNGTQMPMAGIGVFTFTPAEAQAAIESALRDGIRLIDTANAYQNEKATGRAMKASGVKREDIYLVTKLWPSVYESETAVDDTLRRLDTDYIDLLFLHQPTDNWQAGYRNIEKAVKAGKVRSIGISNFDTLGLTQQAIDFAEIKPQTVQVEAHPYYPQTELKKLLAPYGIGLMAWYPLGIPGSRNPAHIRDNFDVFDFALTAEEMAKIATLDKNKRYYNGTPEQIAGYKAWAPDFDAQE